MNRLRFAALGFMMAFTTPGVAQDFSLATEPAKKKFDSKIQAILEKHQEDKKATSEDYVKKLDELIETATTKGDLDKVLVFKAEKDRIESKKPPMDTAESLKVIQTYRVAYEAKKAASIVALEKAGKQAYADYIADLDALIKEETKERRLESALKVKELKKQVEVEAGELAKLKIGIAPRDKDRLSGILVLDDCDSVYKDKNTYEDNLTFLTSDGEQKFRISGFNNSASSGSARAIAVDPARQCFWVLENTGHRIRRFDHAGKETLAIADVHGSAIAVDPVTGNVWALARVGTKNATQKTVVYNSKGSEVASYDITGYDIVYDRTAKAFWIAQSKLTKVDAATGKVTFSIDVSKFTASSVDVDPRTGACWVAVRRHPQIAGSSNRLLKIDARGKALAAVELGEKMPFRVSVDPKDGSVWVANLRKSVEHYSAEGKSLVEHPVEALTVQVDPAGSSIWVVTPTEILKMSSKGMVAKRTDLASKSLGAWIASLD
jgi:DNA-binding beta-propeller fold protein YncE